MTHLTPQAYCISHSISHSIEGDRASEYLRREASGYVCTAYDIHRGWASGNKRLERSLLARARRLLALADRVDAAVQKERDR